MTAESELKIIKISKIRRRLSQCEDFARLRWPKGATDYLASYSDPSYPLVLVGHHMDGWTNTIKRPEIRGWNCYNADVPSWFKPGMVIWISLKTTRKHHGTESFLKRIFRAAKKWMANRPIASVR